MATLKALAPALVVALGAIIVAFGGFGPLGVNLPLTQNCAKRTRRLRGSKKVVPSGILFTHTYTQRLREPQAFEQGRIRPPIVRFPYAAFSAL